jgi:hypothetical protein
MPLRAAFGLVDCSRGESESAILKSLLLAILPSVDVTGGDKTRKTFFSRRAKTGFTSAFCSNCDRLPETLFTASFLEEAIERHLQSRFSGTEFLRV